MKKLISLLLALVMILSLSTVAFAAVEETPPVITTDADSVYIPVTFTLVGAGTSPEVTFTVTQTSKTKTDGEPSAVPDLGIITGAAFTTEDGATATGNAKNIVVNLPTYTSVGVYEYTLTPNTVNLAGVEYRTDTIKLVVTVIDDGAIRVAAVHTEAEGGQKANGIGATYSAGTLNISKTVDGNLGDKNKAFTFKVTLTGVADKTNPTAFTAKKTPGNETVTINLTGDNTITLKHGDTLSIENLPYGVSCYVEEADYTDDGYTTKVGNEEKRNKTVSIADATQNVAFTNTKQNNNVDTGVVLDTLPYVMILAVAAVCGMALLLKKRHMAD